MSLLPKEIEDLPKLKVGTSFSQIEILSGPFVQYTEWGYLAVVHVSVEKSGLEYLLNLSASSLAKSIKQAFDNHGSFIGLRFELRKQGEEKTSKYEINQISKIRIGKK